MKKAVAFIVVMVMSMPLFACQNKSAASLQNVRQMAEKELSAVSMMLGCEWDAEHLPEPEAEFLMIANAWSLYQRDYGETMPTVAGNEHSASEVFTLDVLIPTITKYFSFSEQFLRESFEKSSAYDSQNDAVILGDGWGWGLDAVMHDVKDNRDDTYDIAYGLYTNDVMEYEGIVKAKVHPDGYLQFIANDLDD